MAKIRIHCPKCTAHFKVDEAHVGKKGRCQRCGERFLISMPEATGELLSPAKRNVEGHVRNNGHVEQVTRVLETINSVLSEALRSAGAITNSDGDWEPSEVVGKVLRVSNFALFEKCSKLWQNEFPEGWSTEAKQRLDLSGADFSGSYFIGMPYAGYPFLSANLSQSILDRTTWYGISLLRTDCTAASLRNAKFFAPCLGTCFRRADLTNAAIKLGALHGNLQHLPVDFTEANLTGAQLTFAAETPVTFAGAKMDSCRIKAESYVAEWLKLQILDAVRSTLSPEQRTGVIQGKNKAQCFIATAACGENSEEVRILRQLRDTVFRRSVFGRLVVGAYYTVSPPLASLIKTSPIARRAVRTILVRPLARLAERQMGDKK